MRVLLDTHVLLWAALRRGLLSARAAELIADGRNTVLVSAASAWEIATKVRMGELSGAEVLESRFLELMGEACIRCCRSMRRVRYGRGGW